ncbi:MAG: hypothetical protein JWN86_4106 [Planctomycetota bacterium]|nr:hypothetical protein [Planctomycetota bacterium]
MRRFSIAGLMVVVLVSGVAVAALKNASDAWAGVLLLLTLLLLGISLLGILHRRGGARAFWQGFAIFGWGYLVLSQAPWIADQVGPRLPTTQLLAYAHEKAHPSPETRGTFQFVAQLTGNSQVQTPQATVTLGTPPSGNLIVSGVNRPAPAVPVQTLSFLSITQTNLEQFKHVGHCLFTLLAALIGGGIARGFQRTNREVAIS